MEFNVRRLAADAGTFLSRAVQFTEEKFGQAEKTELDAHLETLLSRTESTKHWTEKIMKQTEVLLQPNPNVRMEEFLYEMLDKKVPMRANNHELLGECMIDSGHEFGPGTAYGSALIKCGETEKLLGSAEKEFIQSSAINFLTPFRNFIEGDFKTISKERKLLQNKRLDLDAAKNRLKKARVADARSAAHHLRCLNDFVYAQATYYAQCYQYMVNLQKQLGSFPSTFSNNNQPAGSSSASIWVPTAQPAASLPAPPPSQASPALNELRSTSGTRKARVLYDYDAASSSELSLLSDEVITVSSVPDMDSDWLMGQRGNQKGKVPITYLELLN
uniref:SH3-domain GRB2-like endophilin B1b n=1 Tax=Cyprinus carpio carpio TaxID=630221 RepID=A0A8C1AD38_CYPCA